MLTLNIMRKDMHTCDKVTLLCIQTNENYLMNSVFMAMTLLESSAAPLSTQDKNP